MTKLPMLDLDVVDVLQIQVSADPADGAMITIKTAGDQDINLHLPPQALAKLEAFLSKATIEQAKYQSIQ